MHRHDSLSSLLENSLSSRHSIDVHAELSLTQSLPFRGDLLLLLLLVPFFRRQRPPPSQKLLSAVVPQGRHRASP